MKSSKTHAPPLPKHLSRAYLQELGRSLNIQRWTRISLSGAESREGEKPDFQITSQFLTFKGISTAFVWWAKCMGAIFCAKYWHSRGKRLKCADEIFFLIQKERLRDVTQVPASELLSCLLSLPSLMMKCRQLPARCFFPEGKHGPWERGERCPA